MSDRPTPLAAWHTIVASREEPGYDAVAALDVLLADDCVFRSPAVFKPQEGKELTKAYLGAALTVLGPTLRYVDEWSSDTGAVLEFEAPLDGILAHGIDMMRWNEAGQLTSFTVMIRPMRGLQKVIELMSVELNRVLGG
ncbi:hypothetical protein [Jatrophihabitans sp.]|uniref:hypothetical protein n=1 Tax=Jatrophihabitans sp. TaxID=1932789 RepID=UPI0030C74D08|nr:hypothetical protein [Jatrophihabitans sp.]